MSETNTNPEARDVIAKAAGMAFSDFSGLNTNEECADAIIAALAAEGKVIVPMEPTDEILRGAHNGPLGAGDEEMREDVRFWLAEMYRAMVAAALPTPGTSMRAVTP